MTTTKLSNADLLDEGLANSKSLKIQRLNQTAERAVNPQPKRENREENYNNKKEESYNFESEEDSKREYVDDLPKNKPDFAFNKNNAQKTSNRNDESKKILGMNPALFYTLAGATLLVGGYFLYTHFNKKKLNKKALDTISDAVGGATAPTPLPDIPMQ